MSKTTITLLTLLFILFSSNCFAQLKISNSATPKNKLRFTSNGEYVASFICNQKIDYKKMNKILSDHFSAETEKNVTGLIWENCKEDSEVMIQIYNLKNKYVGDIRISTNNFVNNGEFIYRIGELQGALQRGLGFNIVLSGFRKKGDNSRQSITMEGDDFVILKL